MFKKSLFSVPSSSPFTLLNFSNFSSFLLQQSGLQGKKNLAVNQEHDLIAFNGLEKKHFKAVERFHFGK